MNKLKVGIIMIDEPFYSNQFIKKLLTNYKIEFVILHTDFISMERVIKTLFIYGPTKFINTVFQVLKNKILGGEINKILNLNMVPTIKTNKVNDSGIVDFVHNKKIDVLISFNCPEKLKKDILLHPNIYPINIHLGYLPEYRGLFPIFHAYINEEQYIGVSIHVMNEKFDDGEILKQIQIKIEKDDDLLSLYEKAFKNIPDLIDKTLTDIIKNQVNFKKNMKKDSTYFSYPTFRDIFTYKKLIKKNKKQ